MGQIVRVGIYWSIVSGDVSFTEILCRSLASKIYYVFIPNDQTTFKFLDSMFQIFRSWRENSLNQDYRKKRSL